MNDNVATVTLERATEFGASWNSHDPDLVASFFADDGVDHASVGPDHMGKTFVGPANIRTGAQEFFERFPTGRFENLVVKLYGDFGTFEWDFVTTPDDGSETRVAGCDFLEFRGQMVTLKNAFRKQKV